MVDKTKTYKVCKNRFLRRTVLTIQILLIGAFALCFFLAMIQQEAAKRSQKSSSEKILDEVVETLQTNDATAISVFEEYNLLNQTTIKSLSNYMIYAHVLDKLGVTDPVELEQNVYETCLTFNKMSTELNLENIFLIDSTGEVRICSMLDEDDKPAYLGKNITGLISNEALKDFTTYKVDSKTNKEIQNGTEIVEDGKTVYKPMHVDVDGESFYFYSSYLATLGEKSYFLTTSCSTELISTELSGIRDISTVLSGITVGKSGFVFAVDATNKKFQYFNDGSNVLTGEDCVKYGLKDSALKNNYSGYQKIDGVKYYCVTKAFSSETYGDFTIVAAAVSKTEIIESTRTSVVMSCVAFVLISALIAGYGMILKRDIADQEIYLADKYGASLKEDVNGGKLIFTDEEIDERTKIYVDEVIERGEDKKLKRRLIGTRNRQGRQRYFSPYIALKLIPISIIGLFIIFIVSFFGQTLLGLDDATVASQTRLNDVVVMFENNEKTSSAIKEYVGDQYLSKARLVSYMIEEEPKDVFNYNIESETTHRIRNNESAATERFVLDDYDNIRLSIEASKALQQLCDANGITSIYVYDDLGNVIATNTDLWYFKLSQTEGTQSYPFNDLLNEKVDYYVQPQTEEEHSGEMAQYIGVAFYYYTYLGADGETKYASKSNYASQLEGSWALNPITKHRSLIQISVNQSTLKGLYDVTSSEYLLGNAHVQGNSSFFMAFDSTENHTVLYSPIEAMIGKSAHDIGIKDNVFKFEGTYNGFQTISGKKYYQSYELVGDYYIATAIPTNSIYSRRNAVAGYTLLFSAIFILIASCAYTLSSDRADNDYVTMLRGRGDQVPVQKKTSSFELLTPSGKKKKTKSAHARYAKVAWSKKTAEEKLAAILLFYSSVASIIIVIGILYVINKKNNSSIFSYIISGGWERGPNVFAFTESLMIMVLILTITKLTQVCVRSFCGALGARIETTGDLIVSVLKYGGIIGGFFYCLYLFGFNTSSLLTSAGILSIVIGLGAQSLISDIIAGIFIVFEGEFRVGDIVTIGNFRGQVLEIGLRTTKIEDIEKNIKIFNNSSISGVLNMTKEASYAGINVSIEYGESLERVEAVLKDAFPEIKKKLPSIIDGPFYKGVGALSDSSVDIKIIAQCEEKDRLQLTRDLNREIFLLFNKHDINIPFPQVTLSHLKEKEVKTSKAESEKAQDFVEEQRTESKGAEISDEGSKG